MIRRLRITVLVNDVARAPLAAEHGLALWVEADGMRILFDTGQGTVLFANAAALCVDLRTVQHVVLSHGHYDHTGGLAAVLSVAKQRPNVYLHPAALLPKYSRRETPPHRSIGIPRGAEKALRTHAETVWTSGPTRIANGVAVTGPIPRAHSFEGAIGPFFQDEACTVPDPLIDDQALYIQTTDGTALLLGCAHAGVANTVDYVTSTTGKPIRAVVGGMHLLNAPTERLEATRDFLMRINARLVAPAHCTGEGPAAFLTAAVPHCVPCTVGSSFQLGDER
ncbi:MAG TPA: MBL fold metallo-hydrolase [Planctomycetota bacterium]|nr:MBL fold metallo-hydrolase [Planctomycetota bacterium]